MKCITLITLLMLSICVGASEVIRYPLPNNNPFPIADAVEIPAGQSLIFVSGKVPLPANPEAEQYSAAYWGNTEAQAVSTFTRISDSLQAMGLGLKDVVKLTVYLVGDPEKGNRMDFAGFMAAYTQFFGTESQPNLPSRAVIQVAGLARHNMLVEIEATAVRAE